MPDELPCTGSEVVRARRLFSGSRHAAARLLIDVPADVVPSRGGRAYGLMTLRACPMNYHVQEVK
jgi:hypothetical protein